MLLKVKYSYIKEFVLYNGEKKLSRNCQPALAVRYKNPVHFIKD